MNTDKSSFLHFLRWVSALFVLIGHSHSIGGGRGGGGHIFVFLASHAHAAVIVFFVLSGYVIASTVDRKRQAGYALKEYYTDRFSRIYSVLIPAIVLTMILDSIGIKYYQEIYGNPALLPQDNYFIRLLINVFSLQGIWGYRVQFGSNPALWSIGYEFCYYILYGLFVWRPRYWIFAALAIAAIVGPKVLVYGFIWLLGVAAFKIQKQVRMNAFIGVLLFICANYIFRYSPHSMFLGAPEFIMDFIFAIFVGIFVLSNPRMPSNKFILRINKEMAEFSYSSYAYHYPILFLTFAILPTTPLLSWSIVLFSLIVARFLYEITEKKRFAIKKTILQW